MSETVKLSEPPPVFETFTVCAAGFAPPCVALNARLVGATDRTGVAGLTVRVTSTVFGEPEAPAAVTVIGVVYVPGASPAIDGVTVTVAGAVPLDGLTESHDADSASVKLRVPPPVLVTSKVCAAGFAPPSVAVKDRLLFETASAGGGGGGVPLQVTDVAMSA